MKVAERESLAEVLEESISGSVFRVKIVPSRADAGTLPQSAWTPEKQGITQKESERKMFDEQETKEAYLVRSAVNFIKAPGAWSEYLIRPLLVNAPSK